ncbi:uncharacterized protein LOC133206348 [Saccostrea echinata]|uniref:uncharacterized protein LOC133206348 n=1 Tax=Saccostrea echinata TaxID=191078 RepID=UPI002A81B729|nr:uncharacterized protein LOC133206348 [Saccostrea echinata]
MAEHNSVRRWILYSLWICATPVYSSTFYFVKDRKIYSKAEEYCRKGTLYQGELAVLSSNQDWDCIPQDVWFWSDKKECRLNIFNNFRCRDVSIFNRLLGLNTRPFLCKTDEDLIKDDSPEYAGYGSDYFFDEDVSICTSPLVPPETTPIFKSTPNPEGSTVAFNTTKNEQSEPDHGWIAGLVMGIFISLIVVVCAVFIFIKRRNPTKKKKDAEVNMDNGQTNERNDRLTSRIGTALQRCKQKFQTKSQPEMYEPPVIVRQEREYDQLSRPMIPSTELVYAEPTMSSAAGIEQDELGYLVSQGSETKEYMYIDTVDSVDGSQSSHEGLDCGNPVYEVMTDKREIIAGNCDKQIQDSDETSSASGVQAVKVRTHEYQNSPAIGRLLKKQQEKSDLETPETAISNGIYDDKFSSPPQMASAVIKDDSLQTATSNDDSSTATTKKNVKGSNIRNIILKLQGASDA